MLWLFNDDKISDVRAPLLKFTIALGEKKCITGTKQTVQWFVILEGEIRS